MYLCRATLHATCSLLEAAVLWTTITLGLARLHDGISEQEEALKQEGES